MPFEAEEYWAMEDKLNKRIEELEGELENLKYDYKEQGKELHEIYKVIREAVSDLQGATYELKGCI